MDDEFLSITEFAEWIHVHPNTVRRAIKSGRITAFRVGSATKSMYRIPKSETNRLAFTDLETIVQKMVEKHVVK
jgi:excisionase family DNA binding protein